MIRRLLLNLATWLRFPGSARYWELRYRTGGTSGAGSYGAEAAYKTEFLNTFFKKNDIHEVIDFGCGDGNQIAGLTIARYTGIDVSPAAVRRCAERYKNDATKTFLTTNDFQPGSYQCAISLDVLYHLVEPEQFTAYLDRLFSSSDMWVVIYASDTSDSARLRGRHVVRRPFTPVIRDRFPDFELVDAPPRPGDLDNPGADASFYIFMKKS